jgi:hypothetical protein
MLVVGSSFLQRPAEAFYGAVTVVAGLPFYFYWQRKKARLGEQGAQ